MPTVATRRWLMPHVGRRPNLAWVSPNLAVSAATPRSHASTSSSAPVKQKPLTLATTSLGIVVSRLVTSRAGRSRTSPTLPPSSRRWPSALRSTPALNARPAPVSTMTSTVSSAPSRSSAAARSTSISPVSALSASGRSSVIVPTPSSMVVVMSAMGMSVSGVDDVDEPAEEHLVQHGPDDRHVRGPVAAGFEQPQARPLEQVERLPVAPLVLGQAHAGVGGEQVEPRLPGHGADSAHRQAERPVLGGVAEVGELPVGDDDDLAAGVDEV